jgi:hypothetical protein
VWDGDFGSRGGAGGEHDNVRIELPDRGPDPHHSSALRDPLAHLDPGHDLSGLASERGGELNGMYAGLVPDEDGLDRTHHGRLALADALLFEELDGCLEWDRWWASGLDEQTIERANAQCPVPLLVYLSCETQTPATELDELRRVSPHVRLRSQDATGSAGRPSGKPIPFQEDNWAKPESPTHRAYGEAECASAHDGHGRSSLEVPRHAGAQGMDGPFAGARLPERRALHNVSLASSEAPSTREMPLGVPRNAVCACSGRAFRVHPAIVTSRSRVEVD